MDFVFYTLLFNFFILTLIIHVKVYIRFQYKKDFTKEYICVEVYMYKKLLLFSLPIPLTEFWKWVRRQPVGENHQIRRNRARKKQRIKKYFNLFLHQPDKFKKLTQDVTYYAWLYQALMDSLIRSLRCEHFEWKTVLGTEDAALTGELTGMIWVGKELFIRSLKNKINFDTIPLIIVKPVFNKHLFTVDFQCIFTVKLGNVISVIKEAYWSKRMQRSDN